MAKREKVKDQLVIDDARILFRNFAGKEKQFNPKGKRNFCVILPDEIVDKLIDDGWNVRFLKPREEGESPVAYMQVSVSFDNFPPKIWMITGNGKVKLDEESVDVLDYAEIESVDLSINPYNWEGSITPKGYGVKAYLNKMDVTLREDEFESKYYDIPDITNG